MDMELKTDATQLADRDFDFLCQLIYAQSHIRLGPDKRTLVTSRLAKRLRQLELPDYHEYCQLLRSPAGAEELPILIDRISTNHTHFFREMKHFDFLRETDAKVKFLSCEPLIGPLHGLDLSGIDWVIVGGERGKKARPIEELWVWDILQQCREAEVAFFLKQWGGRNNKKAGRLLGGNVYSEMPVATS